MDSHTLRTLDRLEIVETGRRRRWTEDEKVRIVLESMAGPRLVAPTARWHNISRSMLVVWRRTFKAAASGESRPAFVQRGRQIVEQLELAIADLEETTAEVESRS